MGRLITILLSITLLAASTAFAHTWYVTPDGMGDVPTIQAAVDTAAPGDTVLLASGVFRGTGNYNINLPVKLLLITSETGDPEDCVIDCEGHLGSGRRGFSFEANWSSGPVIDGVTIRNGHDSDYGGGAVYCEGSLVMRNCIFESNMSESGDLEGGGAIAYYWAGGEPILKKCRFISNEASGRGGAILILGVELYVTVDSCMFYDNRAGSGGAISCLEHEAWAYIRNSVFVSNSASIAGGGVTVENMLAEIYNCTFYANYSPEGSGIASGGSYPMDYPLADVRRCIIAYGTGGTGLDMPPSDNDPQSTNIYGNEGGDWVDGLAYRLGVDGNFSACPSFCNRLIEPYDLSLCDQSPCLPGNHPDGADCGLIGALGEGCICGPTRTEPTTWGAIKAIYK